MKKILVALLATFTLSGCSGDGGSVVDSDGNSEKITTYTYKDPETSCEYIVFNWYQGGGASPKLDSKGQPTGCSELENN